jgi:hypothetical protein
MEAEMATPWKKKVRSAAKLTAMNAGGGWKSVVEDAIKKFNSLGFGVTYESVSSDRPDVVIKLSDGIGEHTFEDPYYGEFTVKAVFDATAVHGKTKTVVDPDKKVIMNAAVFLPNKLRNANQKTKEIVVIHELIHAAGLDDNKDHDKTSGVFYSPLEYSSGNLVEWGTGGKFPPMPPVRVGAQTKCKLRSLWVENAACD